MCERAIFSVQDFQGAHKQTVLPICLYLSLFVCVQVKAEASWDSTVHESPQLSRGGVWPEQRVYLTVRAVVQLSHPADMQLVLRKRICVNLNPGRQVRLPPVHTHNYTHWLTLLTHFVNKMLTQIAHQPIT